MAKAPPLVETTMALFRVVETLLTYVAANGKSKGMIIQVPYDTVLPYKAKYKDVYLTLEIDATWDSKMDLDDEP